MSISYLVVCKTDVSGEEDRQPITAELDFDAFGQFLQRWEVVGGEVVGQGYMELLFMRLNVDLWSVKMRQELVLRGTVSHAWNNEELHLQRSWCACCADRMHNTAGSVRGETCRVMTLNMCTSDLEDTL